MLTNVKVTTKKVLLLVPRRDSRWYIWVSAQRRNITTIMRAGQLVVLHSTHNGSSESLGTNRSWVKTTINVRFKMSCRMSRSDITRIFWIPLSIFRSLLEWPSSPCWARNANFPNRRQTWQIAETSRATTKCFW